MTRRHSVRSAVLVGLVGCAGPTSDLFDVRSGDAVLPVGVYGDLSRSTMIVWESGGPSGPGIAERMVDYIDFRDTLEEEVAMVYYDRRGTGNAVGSYRSEDLSMDVLLDDLHTVVQVLDARYAPEHLLLMGHSFGSLSSALYVQQHPETFEGWVAVAPAWTNQDIEAELHYRRQFAMRVAQERIDAGDPDPVWPRAIAFGEANPVIEPSTDAQEELYTYLGHIEELEIEPTIDTLGLLGTVFGSHYNLIDTQMRANRISGPVWDSVDGLDALEVLESVGVPTLAITGQYDSIGNTEIAQAGLDRLDTDDKGLLEIPGGGHYPFLADPDGFAAEVLDFAADMRGR